MGSDEGIIAQFGPGPPHPVDLPALTGTQAFPLVEAPDPVEQPLPPQDLMETGDAAAETVGGVEVSAVAVGDGDSGRGEGRVNTPRAAALQQRDGNARIDRPMPEKPADEPQRLPLDVERKDSPVNGTFTSVALLLSGSVDVDRGQLVR